MKRKPGLEIRGNQIVDLFTKPAYKAPRRELSDPNYFDEYKRERDMIILNLTGTCEASKKEIKEKYGI